MNHLDLFSGIGGFSLGLEAAGMKTVAFCEIEKFPCKVLAKNWPGIPIYNDVRTLTNERLKSDGIPRIDILTGGFPCQDISVAGNQKGISSETRSGLWSECARLLGEIRPKYAIFENVTALLNGAGGDWFKRVLWDISQVGYDAEWHCIPASELGAHHHRDRIWIIAYPSQERCNDRQHNWQERHIQNDEKRQPKKVQPEGNQWKLRTSASCKILSDTDSKRGRGRNSKRQNAENAGQPLIGSRINFRRMESWDSEPELGRVANGIPNRTHRLKGLGNAVVPYIPKLIGEVIMQIENNP